MVDYDLDKMDVDTNKLAHKSQDNKDLFDELLKGIRSREKTVRNNSFNTLMILCENNGEYLYPKWDYIHEMLINKNINEQYIAIYLLASLTSVDSENKFETIFDEYFGILDGDKTMTASHVILNSAKIVKNKPGLRSEIIAKLLNTDKIFKGRQKDIIKVYAIETLRKIHPEGEEKIRIENFIKSQLNSPSSRTRSAARCYIDRCDIRL